MSYNSIDPQSFANFVDLAKKLYRGKFSAERHLTLKIPKIALPNNNCRKRPACGLENEQVV